MALNRYEAIGRLGKDAELKSLNSGDSVCNFSIAVSEKFKNKNGEPQERTEWIRCVAWRKLADICGQYLKKGMLVYIAGKLQSREWTDDNEAKHSITEINLSEMQMLSSKTEQPAHQEPAPAIEGFDDLPF